MEGKNILDIGSDCVPFSRRFYNEILYDVTRTMGYDIGEHIVMNEIIILKKINDSVKKLKCTRVLICRITNLEINFINIYDLSISYVIPLIRWFNLERSIKKVMIELKTRKGYVKLLREFDLFDEIYLHDEVIKYL